MGGVRRSALALSLLVFGHAAARGEPPAAAAALPREQPGFAELYGRERLVPTPAEERARWMIATAGELSRSLAQLPGVADARVHLALSHASNALDAEPPLRKASVLLRREAGRGPPVDEEAVRALVAGAVEGLTPDAVSIVQLAPERREPPAETALVQVGPIAVAHGSVGALKAILGGALALDIALAVGLVAVWRLRGRRAGLE
jgi:type III secretion protein J